MIKFTYSNLIVFIRITRNFEWYMAVMLNIRILDLQFFNFYRIARQYVKLIIERFLTLCREKYSEDVGSATKWVGVICDSLHYNANERKFTQDV